jgi:lambda family phage portal protein
MGLLGRAIAVAEELAPEWALRRAVARERRQLLNYGHHGASHTKTSTRGWRSSANGPDTDIVLHEETLRSRSRDLCMGEPLAIGALKTIRSNEVGSGLRLNASIDAEYLGLTDDEALAWEASVEREFALWAGRKGCDVERRCNFGQLQALARLSQLMSGDVFALLPSIPRPGERYDLRVKLLEADRVSNPLDRAVPVGTNIFGGVEVGEDGEPLAYWVENMHPGDVFTSGYLRLVPTPKWERIPAFGEETGRPLVLHVMESERPGQRRGVPILAPVMERLKQLSRYSDAEIMAAVVSGLFTVAITSDTAQTPIEPLPLDEKQPLAAGQQPANQVALGNGAIVGLNPGEKVESINPARPNAGFEPFVIAVCRQIGAGLGLPYELLVMQFTASYSASRGALLEAWKRFSVGRTWLAADFCQPIYEQWLAEAVARGHVKAPGFFSDPVRRAAWCGAEWHGPSQGQLNPIDEVEAAEKRVEGGFSTRARETAELTGMNWDRNHKVRVREERLRRDGQVATNPSTSTADDPPAVEADPNKKNEAAA